MNKLTTQQWFIIAIGMCSTLGGLTAQLTQLFGAAIASDVAAAVGILGGLIAVPASVVSGQASQLSAVQAMPGVSKVLIGPQANTTAAQMAVSGDNPKIQAEPGAEAKVAAIANQG